MPMDFSRYPANWKEISLAVRKRAGWICQQCGVSHGEVVRINRITKEREFAGYQSRDLKAALQYAYEKNLGEGTDEGRWYPVVLTVAHVGAALPDGSPGDKHDKLDVRPENLKALCQRCHLRLDLNDHITNRRYGRDFRRHQTTLFK